MSDCKEILAKRLNELRQIDGFPNGADENILNLSNPPYYTACPSPFVNQFVQNFGKKYTEINDTYFREPFVGDVSESKADPIYNAHSYHTKVPHRAIMQFIEHYTDENDLVLDGFCGSGMTGVAAQLLNRNCILSDLSPIATFIAHKYNHRVDVSKFVEESQLVISKLEKEYGWMYETKPTINENTGNLQIDIFNKIEDYSKSGKINYTVWSDVLICPYCREEYIFYDAAVDKENEKVLEMYKCTCCHEPINKDISKKATIRFYDNLIKEEVEQVKQVPVLIKYTLRVKQKGKWKNLQLEKKPDAEDIRQLAKIEELQYDSWFPTEKMMNAKTQKWGDTWRAGVHFGISHIHHFYTKRSLLILSALRKELNDDTLGVFTSIVTRLVSRIVAYQLGKRGNVPTSGTLFISSIPVEANIFKVFEGKIKTFASAYAKLKYTNCLVQTTSATNLNCPDNSIDYIFTDPPFGSNLMYSELNFIMEGWLKVFTHNKSEAIISSSQNKELPEYNQLMCESFRELYRVLKPKRWLTVVFHNSQSAVWNGIREAITKSGFIIAQVSVLDKKQGSYKQLTAPGAVANDLIISAFKPAQTFEREFIKYAGENLETAFVHEFLSTIAPKPIIERTEKMLFSKMVSYYLLRGYDINLDATDFYNLLNSNFINEDGFWFTANQVNSYLEYKKQMKLEGLDEVKSSSMFLFITDEQSAIVWLYHFLDRPKSYSELLTAFNQIANIESDTIPELMELLEQNFINDSDGYRRPSSEFEHSQINDKRNRTLHREFESLLLKAQSDKGKLKFVRKEAVRYGFELCYKDKRFSDIILMSKKLDKKILDSDDELNDFVEAAEIMIQGVS